MRGIAVIIVLVLSVCGAVALSAQGKSARIALLIGNQGYTAKVGPLKNPHHDVDRIGAVLKRLGFQVTIVKDAKYRALDGAVRRYVDEVQRAGSGAISFFYYSGHGAANPENQINYLIPVDATSADSTELWYQSFEQSSVIDRLSRRAPNAAHFVVFDACRNELNVSGSLKKGLGDEKGFVPVNDVRGMLIAYATGEKRTASDNGMFAKILAEELPKKGVEAVEMFRRVQLRMQQTLNQEPWMSLHYLPKVYLGGDPKAGTTENFSGADTDAEATQEWANMDMNSMAMLETFLQRHGKSEYADYARARLEELKHSQTASGVPPVQPQAVPGEGHPFDGRWRIQKKHWNCSGSGKGLFFLEISNNKILPKQFYKGSVLPDGTFKMVRNLEGGRLSDYSGKLGANSGSGRFSHLNGRRSKTCQGTFTAKREAP